MSQTQYTSTVKAKISYDLSKTQVVLGPDSIWCNIPVTNRLGLCVEAPDQDVVIKGVQANCNTCGSTGLQRSPWRRSPYCRRSFNSKLHIHLLVVPPLPLLIPHQSVCRYTQTHKCTVGICGLLWLFWGKPSGAAEDGAVKKPFSPGSERRRSMPSCLQLHGDQTKTEPIRRVFLWPYTCKRHHWFCLTIFPHTFVSGTEERQTPSRRLVFWAYVGLNGRVLITLI